MDFIYFTFDKKRIIYSICTVNQYTYENFVSSLATSGTALAFGAPGAKGVVAVLRGAKEFALTDWDIMSRTWSMFGAGLTIGK